MLQMLVPLQEGLNLNIQGEKYFNSTCYHFHSKHP